MGSSCLIFSVYFWVLLGSFFYSLCLDFGAQCFSFIAVLLFLRQFCCQEYFSTTCSSLISLFVDISVCYLYLFWLVLYALQVNRGWESYPSDWTGTYNGTRNKTVTGKTCSIWRNTTHSTYGSINYCRTPVEDPVSSIGPWCYVNEAPSWEFCVVQFCSKFNDFKKISMYILFINLKMSVKKNILFMCFFILKPNMVCMFC